MTLRTVAVDERRYEESQTVPNDPSSRSVKSVQRAPIPTILNPDETNLSHHSNSLAHATEHRNYSSSRLSNGFVNFSDFKANVAGSVLPWECKEYFNQLGQAIFDIGLLLFPCEAQPPHTEDRDRVLRIVSVMLKAVQYSSEQVDGQILRLAYLKSLLSFNYKPGQTYLWSTYCQRAKLIISHSALPCRTELDLLEQLAHLYDTYVYNSVLHHALHTNLEHYLINSLHDIYNNIMAWLYRYQRWCSSMTEIKQNYLVPLMRSMIASPKVVCEIREIRKSKDKALSSLYRHKSAVSLPTNEKPMEAWKLSTGRIIGGCVKKTMTRDDEEQPL